MTERRLRVRARSLTPRHSEGETWSLFARLSSRTAQDLFHDASTLPDSDSAILNGWSISSCSPWNIEFLPLKVSLDSGVVIYTSFNGGLLTDEDCIEVPSCQLPTVADCQYVIVRALPSVKDAASIEMDPLTSDDWELMDIHSEFLENGGLLAQISIVYPLQILILKVGGRDTVKVRVMASAFMQDVHCLRLVANTEVTIIPKQRLKPVPKSPTSPPLRVVPTWDEWSPQMQALALQEDIHVPIVPPCTLMAHPKTLQIYLPGYQDIDVLSRIPLAYVTITSSMTTPPTRALVQIMESEDVIKDHVALHTLIQLQLGITPFDDMVTVQLMSETSETSIFGGTTSLMQQGLVLLSIEPVLVELKPSHKYMSHWHYPSCLAGNSSSDNSPLVVFGKWQLPVLSWTTTTECAETLPLGNGTLIPHPSSGDQTIQTQLFRVSLYIESTESMEQELCIRLHDVLVLLDSNSSAETTPSLSSFTKVSRISNNLNWLPATPNFSTETFQKLFFDASSHLQSRDGIILYGEKGTGKTHTALMIAALSRLRKAQKTVYLDCARLQSAVEIRMHETLTELSSFFDVASKSSPSLLILDNLDFLLPNLATEKAGESSSNSLQVNPIELDQIKLVADHVFSLCRDLSGDVKILITCNEIASITPSALPTDRWYECFHLPNFGKVEIDEMILMLINHVLRLPLIQLPQDVNRKREGFRPSDIERLCAIVFQNLRSKVILSGLSNPLEVCNEMFELSMSGFTPLSKQGIRNVPSSQMCNWDDIGGLFEAKKQLTESIVHPIRYRRIYEKAPTPLPRGILLFGPPGCGKSIITPALAEECNLTLITCHGPELLDKYIGASEHKVRQLFARAQAAAPSLLFLDEFEALAPCRGSDHTGVSDRVVNQLLTLLDGVEMTLDHVYIVAATSRPEKIDPALLRPGRLEKHIYIGFPATEKEWTDVFSKVTRYRNVDEEVLRRINEGRLYSDVVESPARNFSPADFKAVLDTAQLAAVHQYIANDSKGVLLIRMEHIREALLVTKPSLPSHERDKLYSLYSKFRGLRPEVDLSNMPLKTSLR